jgi:hypothetical protein
VTVTVAVHALPAVATVGLPFSAMLRSFARAARGGRERGDDGDCDEAGSARRRVGAPGEDRDAAAAEFDRDRRIVVGVGALAQRAVRVRAVNEDVAALPADR